MVKAEKGKQGGTGGTGGNGGNAGLGSKSGQVYLLGKAPLLKGAISKKMGIMV